MRWVRVAGVFDPFICDGLIAYNKVWANLPSGLWMQAVEADMPWTETISQAFRMVLFPQLRFHLEFEPTHADPYRIARYDKGASFPAHRDVGNLPGQGMEETRRYAVSVALNENYFGGDLYINDRKANNLAGDALVWSVDTLHEVKPVEMGQRFVCLTFLHGELPRCGSHGPVAAERERSST